MELKRPFIVVLLALFLLAGCSDNQPPEEESGSLPQETVTVHDSASPSSDKPDVIILASWSGDFPVARLNLLPTSQQESPVGYINNAETFAAVWTHCMPDESIPDIDFNKNIVIFSRNVQFYNRTNIFKVELENGIAKILAMETMSSIPIKDKVAMAMAVIPRQGIKGIKGRDGIIEVK